jgi:hypothetical protein
MGLTVVLRYKLLVFLEHPGAATMTRMVRTITNRDLKEVYLKLEIGKSETFNF